MEDMLVLDAILAIRATSNPGSSVREQEDNEIQI